MLYPKGCDSVFDIPWFLQVAIDQGLMILNWRENLTSEEVPPEHIWEDSEGLDEWWKQVDAKRRDGMPMTTARRGSDDDDEDSDDRPESMGMAQNELAKALRG